MTIQRLVALSAVALAASMSASYAGPCSNDIDSMQARIDAKLERKASTGPAAPESTDATMHRQLTPGSIAAAEERLGEMSPLTAVAQAMTRAREADSAGDKSACERALAEAQRALGP
jgi:hypothetical protein